MLGTQPTFGGRPALGVTGGLDFARMRRASTALGQGAAGEARPKWHAHLPARVKVVGVLAHDRHTVLMPRSHRRDCCLECVQAGRSRSQRIAFHRAKLAAIQAADRARVPAYPPHGGLPPAFIPATGPATSRWFRRALTLDVWFGGALAIWYVFLLLLVLAGLGFVIYLFV